MHLLYYIYFFNIISPNNNNRLTLIYLANNKNKLYFFYDCINNKMGSFRTRTPTNQMPSECCDAVTHGESPLPCCAHVQGLEFLSAMNLIRTWSSQVYALDIWLRIFQNPLENCLFVLWSRTTLGVYLKRAMKVPVQLNLGTTCFLS